MVENLRDSTDVSVVAVLDPESCARWSVALWKDRSSQRLERVSTYASCIDLVDGQACRRLKFVLTTARTRRLGIITA